MSKEKSEQLGMSYGKAGNILRKNIMFELAKRCNMDTCHRCGEKIEHIDQFSIEHKINWLHSDDPVGLFFGMDNIAFSHITCNFGARRSADSNPGNIGATGYRGVIMNRDSKKEKFPYVARLNIKGTKKFLGYFTDPKKAAEEYDKRAIELIGPNAVTNKTLGLL